MTSFSFGSSTMKKLHRTSQNHTIQQYKHSQRYNLIQHFGYVYCYKNIFIIILQNFMYLLPIVRFLYFELVDFEK